MRLSKEVQGFLSVYTKLNPATDCREWVGGTDTQGYGVLRVAGKKWKAHRYVWFLIHSSFKKPCVLHKCDNPPCCNPDHLWNGTQAENVEDCERKGRAVHPAGEANGHYTKPECTPRGDRNGSRTKPESRPRGDLHWSRTSPDLVLRGERHGSARLTDVIVGEMRRRYVPGLPAAHKDSVKSMATEFNVHWCTAYSAIRGRRWKHVR